MSDNNQITKYYETLGWLIICGSIFTLCVLGLFIAKLHNLVLPISKIVIFEILFVLQIPAMYFIIKFLARRKRGLAIFVISVVSLAILTFIIYAFVKQPTGTGITLLIAIIAIILNPPQKTRMAELKKRLFKLIKEPKKK